MKKQIFLIFGVVAPFLLAAVFYNQIRSSNDRAVNTSLPLINAELIEELSQKLDAESREIRFLRETKEENAGVLTILSDEIQKLDVSVRTTRETQSAIIDALEKTETGFNELRGDLSKLEADIATFKSATNTSDASEIGINIQELENKLDRMIGQYEKLEGSLTAIAEENANGIEKIQNFLIAAQQALQHATQNTSNE